MLLFFVLDLGLVVRASATRKCQVSCAKESTLSAIDRSVVAAAC